MERKHWKVVIESGSVKYDFASGFASQKEAEKFADYYDWFWLDENEFEWRMEVDEE